ncbi:MAG: hypothetical protein M1118_14930 [Chloroflexi bacterium]|nr:hypothetical protein [Chloroflexota bacterium]
MVEALTIVLAVGVTRSWRSTNLGVAAALLALGVTVAVLGPAVALIPIDVLRIVVGALLLIFGLQWLRKAVLRASGYKALHDEAAIFQKEIKAAQAAGIGTRNGIDWYSFTISFKGVFLEGMEVIFIVITFGSAAHSIGLAAVGAAAAVIIVGAAGVLVHQPLSQVPENWLKFAVGLLLTTFGTFWGAEGAGVQWPAQDAALLGILAFLIICSSALVSILRRQRESSQLATAVSH